MQERARKTTVEAACSGDFEVLVHLDDGTFSGPFSLHTFSSHGFAVEVGEGLSLPLPVRAFTPLACAPSQPSRILDEQVA